MFAQALLLLFTLRKWVAEDQRAKAMDAVDGSDNKVRRRLRVFCSRANASSASARRREHIETDRRTDTAISQSTAASCSTPGTSRSRRPRCARSLVRIGGTSADTPHETAKHLALTDCVRTRGRVLGRQRPQAVDRRADQSRSRSREARRDAADAIAVRRLFALCSVRFSTSVSLSL